MPMPKKSRGAQGLTDDPRGHSCMGLSLTCGGQIVPVWARPVIAS